MYFFSVLDLKEVQPTDVEPVNVEDRVHVKVC